jgi:CheY-like chemotaxis protein
LQYLKDLLAREQPLPDILFLDIRMPEMTGFELLDKLLQAYPIEAIKKMRIFMLTSSLDENDNQKAADNPLIEGYLGKPLDIVELVKILS